MHASEIQALMAAHRVFGALPEGARQTLASQAQVRGFAPGEVVLADSDMPERLGWLLDGSVELTGTDAGWRWALRPGELFGAGVQPADAGQPVQALAAARSQVLLLDAAALAQAAAAQPLLRLLLPTLAPPATTAAAIAAPAPSGNAMSVPVGSLIKRAPVQIDHADSILDAVRRMAQEQVSSILLTQDGQLCGLLTDRDLRTRVLAAGVDTARPVAEIATLAPLTLQRQQPIFEAMVLMARHNIHHLPVLDGARVAGMVTADDLNQHQSASAMYLTSDIHAQTGLAGLVACSARVKDLQGSLAKAETSAHSTGLIMTSVTDAFTIRLIQLAEQQLGPPPVGYCWVAAGSQARMEQTARSDQDNCLVLSDDFRPEAHGDYFQRLARQVCDGLDACGYVHCPGEMMAMTGQWRQPRSRWDAYFAQWTEQPDPMALMLTCVFFDLRAVHGDAALLHGLRHTMLRRTQGNSLFLAHMVGNALKHRPALGLFGQLAVSRSGEHRGSIDLKHNGIVPMVDLARIYALAGALDAVNTQDRLAAAGHSGEVSAQAARDLGDALEFISALRIAHQTRQIAAGQAPDNFLRPDELSSFERGTLKDAFGLVQKLQSVLAQRYGGRS